MGGVKAPPLIRAKDHALMMVARIHTRSYL